jgi:SAM-dependent methyltransferase
MVLGRSSTGQQVRRMDPLHTVPPARGNIQADSWAIAVTSDILTHSDLAGSLVVRALCRDLLTRGVHVGISTSDEMLHFFQFAQGHDLERAVAMYLESGHRIWATERQILAWRFGSLGWGGRMLDFASGYGRITRHIVAEVPPGRVWVSDIYAEGVAFQERELGVHGIVSTTEPDRLPCDLGFDAILVSSLFTHLPETRFVAWLRRLGALVNPGGLLLFSVHDMSLRREPTVPADFVFEAMSESGSLDHGEYGSSWVTEGFVRSAVQAAIGPFPVLRIPRGLASFQDLYVVLKEEGAAPDVFADLRIERAADGFLEYCSWGGGAQSLQLSGWVADRVTGMPPCEVRIRIDGALVATCRDLQLRPSTAQTFAADPAEAVGWQAVVELPEGSDPESARLSVRPVSITGEEMSLYDGSIAAACLRSAQLDTLMIQGELAQRDARHREALGRTESRLAELGARNEELARRLHAVEASRFWKVRNLWFRFKRAVGLTPKL